MHEVSSRPNDHLCPGAHLGQSTLQIYYITALNISDTVQFMITSAVCVIDYTESFLLAKYSGYNMIWFSVQCFEGLFTRGWSEVQH